MRGKFPVIPLILIGLFSVWGLRWGLPSKERTDLFLDPQLRNPEFYAKVEKARNDLYAKMGDNIYVYMGRLAKTEQPNNLPTMFNSYSSFLLKTHAIDEAATLSFVSRLDPLKNRWYPHAFTYGGAYLYPLGAYFALAHALHVIKLVASPAFYYVNPQEIARIYTAARVLSVGGLLAASLAVFCIGESLLERSIAVWGMLFFGLAPTCMAYTKYAKPHTWACTFSLWAIYLALTAKKNPSQLKFIAGSSVLLGWALGMTVTQIAFLPFLLWAAWTSDIRLTIRRGILVLGIVGGVYLMTNFYLFAHVRDYLDEKAFNSQMAPFRLRWGGVWDFAVLNFRVSLGWELWALTLVGLSWACIQTRHRTLKSIALVIVIVILYLSFQLQKLHGEPSMSRHFLALIGLLCIMASAVTFQWASAGPVVRWSCLAVLLIKGGIYDEHFSSDKAPYDNASLAAQWVSVHVPAHSLIGQPLGVPAVDCFPPIRFTRYQVVSFESDEFKNAKGPLYAIVSPGGPDWMPMLRARHFLLVQRFNESPLQKLGFHDPFSLANFPLEIYGRDISGSKEEDR